MSRKRHARNAETDAMRRSAEAAEVRVARYAAEQAERAERFVWGPGDLVEDGDR